MPSRYCDHWPSLQWRAPELKLIVQAAREASDPALDQYEKRLREPPAQALGGDLADGDKAMRVGNWAGAVAAYERILGMTDGRNVLVLNNLAYAELMLGNYARSDALAQRALKLAADNPQVLDTAGWARFKSGGDASEARRLLQRAASKDPGNRTIRAHLAAVERQKN